VAVLAAFPKIPVMWAARPFARDPAIVRLESTDLVVLLKPRVPTLTLNDGLQRLAIR